MERMTNGEFQTIEQELLNDPGIQQAMEELSSCVHGGLCEVCPLAEAIQYLANTANRLERYQYVDKERLTDLISDLANDDPELARYMTAMCASAIKALATIQDYLILNMILGIDGQGA